MDLRGSVPFCHRLQFAWEKMNREEVVVRNFFGRRRSGRTTRTVGSRTSRGGTPSGTSSGTAVQVAILVLVVVVLIFVLMRMGLI